MALLTKPSKKRLSPASRVSVKDHLLALNISSELTTYFRRKFQPGSAMIRPEDIFPLFNQGKIKFVLMGVHGINGWRDEARSTQDIDFLIAKKDHAKAIKIIRQAYPTLIMNDTLVVTRFTDPTINKVIIDLMKPEYPVLKATFRNSIAIENTHRVPCLEMALVTKFAAMVSPYRLEEKKYLDGGDFINMARVNMDEIAIEKLTRLAEKVYKGGGQEIKQMIEDIKAGRRIQF